MDFKKVTALFLALLLLLSNAGLAFNVHYCGGKMASVSSVFASAKVCKMEQIKVEKPCCAKKLAEQHQKCCKDKTVHFKSKTDQSTVKGFSFELPASFVFPSLVAFQVKPVAVFKTTSLNAYCCDAHAPPLFRLYSQYLFYA